MIKRFLVGILLGSGAILPGISSGVLCVIFGMYDKLVDSILGLFKNFKKNFIYLFPIAVGGFFGVFAVSNVLKFFFNNFQAQTKFCFIGLILGSIPILIKKINTERTFKMRYLIFTFFSFILGYFLVILERNYNYIEGYNFFSNNFLILSGFLMSIGIIVPGVSNTLILMCLRSLSYIFKCCIYIKFECINTIRNRCNYWKYSIFNINETIIKIFLHANLLCNNRIYTRKCFSFIHSTRF